MAKTRARAKAKPLEARRKGRRYHVTFESPDDYAKVERAAEIAAKRGELLLYPGSRWVPINRFMIEAAVEKAEKILSK